MLKKILIIGARGNLGQQLVKVFEDNCDVLAWDRKELDITDKELVLKKVKDVKPDIIVNTAAYNAVDKCETDEKKFDLAKKINGGAVGYLAEAALENNAVLVHYSSDYVFNGDNKNGYKEDDEPNPISKYGETKLIGERAVVGAGKQGLKYYLIRTSKLFGPQAVSKASKPSFFEIMLSSVAKAMEGKKEIDVVNEEVSCFTYTPDLAKATKDLVENKRHYGIYHIANIGPCTWYEAAKELFKIAGMGIKVNPVGSNKFPRPAKRPKYSVLLNTKLDNLRDYKEALREYLKIERFKD